MLKRKIALNTPMWMLVGSSKDPDFDPSDASQWDSIFESGRGVKMVSIQKDQLIVDKHKVERLKENLKKYFDLLHYMYRKEHPNRRGFHMDKRHFNEWADNLEKTSKEFFNNFKYHTVND